MKIYCNFPTVNIQTLHFLFSNMHCEELHLDNCKGDFLNTWIFFFAPSDSRFTNSCISDKYCSALTNQGPGSHTRLVVNLRPTDQLATFFPSR